MIPVPAKQTSSRRGPWLMLLALFLLAAEVLPVFLQWKSGGAWALKNFEDFDVAYWAPLKVAYPSSYYFNHGGFLFTAALKAVHLTSNLLAGSPFVSYAHLQIFGYLVRVLFSALALVTIALFWRLRPHPLSMALAAGIFLSFEYATPYIFMIYRFRIGAQLSLLVLALVIAFTTLAMLSDYLDELPIAPYRRVLLGVLAGVTLFEAPHFLPFLLPVFLFTILAASSPPTLRRTVLYLTAGVLGGACSTLLLCYFRDYHSALAALASIVRGLRTGFPLPQPGFEQFANLRLEPHSTYFFTKLVLLSQVLIVLTFLAISVAKFRTSPVRPKVAAIIIWASFVIIWLLHLHIWRTHGSYTTVFSLVYYGFITTALIIASLAHATTPFPSVRARYIVIGALGLAGLGPSLLTLGHLDYRGIVGYSRREGVAFRSLNNLIDRFPKPVHLLISSDVTYFLLAAHCDFAARLYHSGDALNHNIKDGRYGDEIQTAYFPQFSLIYPVEATAVHWNFAKAALESSYRLAMPEVAPALVLLPVAAGVGENARTRLAADRQRMAWTNASDARDPLQVLLASPHAAISSDGSAGALSWSIAPLAEPEAEAAVLANAWPHVWSSLGRRFFLVSTPSGFYLLAAAITQSLPAPAQDSAGAPNSGKSVRSDFGRLRLKLRLPTHRPHEAEPLVTTGSEERGDILYIIYDDASHIRIGFDHWFVGGPISDPIALDYGRDHEVVISMGSLFPDAKDPLLHHLTEGQVKAVKNKLWVELDGKQVFNTAADFYRSRADQVEIGTNLIGASTCGERFTGLILSLSRFWPNSL